MNNEEQINKVIDYIEEHLQDENSTLTTIAQEIGYLKYHLYRMFTMIAGITIYQQLQRRRFNEAARMLIYEDIALISGYDTQRSFSKSFKALFKMSPSSYRKQQKLLLVQLKLGLRTVGFQLFN